VRIFFEQIFALRDELLNPGWLDKIRRNQLAKKLTIHIDYKADFWGKIAPETTLSFWRDKFLKGSSRENLLYAITTNLTFVTKILPARTLSSFKGWTQYSKVCLRKNLLYTMTKELTFEKQFALWKKTTHPWRTGQNAQNSVRNQIDHIKWLWNWLFEKIYSATAPPRS